MFFILFFLGAAGPLCSMSTGEVYGIWDEVKKSGDWVRGEDAFTRAVREHPEEVSFHTMLNFCLRKLKKNQEALNRIEPVYKKFPLDRSVREHYLYSLLDLGWQLVEEGNKEKACDYFTRAYGLDQGNEWAQNAYGYALGAKNLHGESVEVFERAFREHPGNRFIRENLFWSYVGLSDQCLEQKEYVKSANAVIRAYEKRKEGKEAEDKADSEALIANRLHEIAVQLSGGCDFKTGFQIAEDLDKRFGGQFFVYLFKGTLEYYNRKKAGGISLVNRGYELYIQQHPTYKKILLLDPPVKGTYTIVGNSHPDIITHAGMNRYCFDFIGVSGEGKTRDQENTGMGENADYFGFGRLICSPADGIAEKVVDGFPDLPPSGTYRIQEGNMLCIKDEKGLHYLFVHNRLHSARVKQGQMVKKGEILAEIGNSGMTTIPHLHFGVYADNWLVSLPVRFKSYDVINKNGARTAVRNAAPQTDQIVEFK